MPNRSDDFKTSIIRTLAPYLAAAVIAIPGMQQLLDRTHTSTTMATQSLTVVVSFLLGALWYLVARVLETHGGDRRKRIGGAMLLRPRQPTY